MSFGLGEYARTEDITFDVVDTPYQYNPIFERRLLNTFYAVPHHSFLCMKMPGPRGIIKVLGIRRRPVLLTSDVPQGSERSTSSPQLHPRRAKGPCQPAMFCGPARKGTSRL